MKYVYGPVPSRRLGLSLGVSPIPNKTCNYSCVYCQLGRTSKMLSARSLFYPVEEILAEIKTILETPTEFDVITIVGEGEPTLYLGLGKLIDELKILTSKPIAVITNGALLADDQVKSELMQADIVLPSLDATDEIQFKRINRPHKQIDYSRVLQGLIDFSMVYGGELWLEIMLIKGMNDDEASMERFSEILKRIHYKKLYINSPIRPPAEENVYEADEKQLERAVALLNGISIDRLSSIGFHSEIEDDFEALLSIIQRHPMNQFEILDFLKSRSCIKPDEVIGRLNASERVEYVYYKGYNTYRIRNK